MDDTEVECKLRELVAAWRVASSSGSMARRDHMIVGLCVYGFTAHTVALVETLLELSELGRLPAATPLVRQAMECALTAVWLERGGYVEALTLVREQARQQRNAVDEYIRAGISDDAAIRGRLERDLGGLFASATGAGEKFHERCKELEGADSYYALYRTASQVCHASTAVVDLYVAEEQSGTSGAAECIRLRMAPRASVSDGWMRALLPLLVVATSAWSRIDVEHSLRTHTKTLARELEIAWRPAHTPYGLAQKAKRAREWREWQRTHAPRPEPAA